MRFFENGPSIPDELLVARDEGRVVFFCGAGVSRARAGLLDFFGLAEQVIRTLGVDADHPACKVLNVARDIEAQTGVTGLISADRIFGLLERDFVGRDIETAVATALKPLSNVDLSAHQVLVQLATTPTGKLRLVTTNFDRLFDDCTGAKQIWKPPRLPDPSRDDDMDGVVYLHGRSNIDYSGSEGDGFVLSSAEFGRAYLSDGWATNFFRAIVERHVVVFVGYSADDPPVQYLLEALNKTNGQLGGVYAFQSGSSNEAGARWLHKGVEAIAYSDADSHSALWRTFDAWAARAKAPFEWYRSVVELAKRGPADLAPYERGQVAHTVSTIEGAAQFADGDDPPSAEWLWVFDSHQRYAKPQYEGGRGLGSLYFDPFDIYGLDSDSSPAKIYPEDLYPKRARPEDAWDCFSQSRLDRTGQLHKPGTLFRGHWAKYPQELPPRLRHMSDWIGKVSSEPIAIWWAAQQTSLHPYPLRQIQWHQDRSQFPSSRIVRQAWHYLFEIWDSAQDSHRDYHDWYNLKATIDKDGWDFAVARRFALICRPGLVVSTNFLFAARPVGKTTVDSARELFALDVKYPQGQEHEAIPDEWLTFIVKELRKNLELAVTLEEETGGYALSTLGPITRDENPHGLGIQGTDDLMWAVKSFSVIVARLMTVDISAAVEEFNAWPSRDDSVFCRLRIWASGQEKLVSPEGFGAVVSGLSDRAFWSRYHQRDLMLTLAARWNNVSPTTRQIIEARLLNGRARWTDEDGGYDARRARESLSRITWLAEQGCALSADIQREIIGLRLVAPQWTQEEAKTAVESTESRGVFVRTDAEYSILLGLTLANIIEEAKKLSGRHEDFLIEKAPFTGLSASRPVLAFRALTCAAKHGDFPMGLWRTFFNSEARKNDSPKFSALIAERFIRYSTDSISAVFHPYTSWLLNASANLIKEFPASFKKAVSHAVSTLRSQPSLGASGVTHSREATDWVMAAINSPTGHLAQAIFKAAPAAKAGEQLPSAWRSKAESLLALPDDMRRHALVIFLHNLNWFHSVDPHWTDAQLLNSLDSANEDERHAFWNGFFWGAQTPSQPLYIRLKPFLLALAKEAQWSHGGRSDVLAAIILAGWGSIETLTDKRCVSSYELRDLLVKSDDAFRCRILWQMKMWSKDSGDASATKIWRSHILTILRDVWPLQKSVKTSKTSAALLELAFSDEDLFSTIASLVQPLLTTIVHGGHLTPHISDENSRFCGEFSVQTLALMYAVLSDDPAEWPYGAEGVLKEITRSDNDAKFDTRLMELNRRLAAR